MKATPEHCRICGRHHRRCVKDPHVNEHGALLLALAEIDTYARHVHEELSTAPCLIGDEQSPLWLISLSDLLAQQSLFAEEVA